MRAPSLAFALLLIGGCGDPNAVSPEQQEMLDRLDVEWRDLPDGSKFGKSGGLNPEDEYAARCWEWRDGLARCVEGGVTHSAGFSRTSVSIEFHDDLPSTLGPRGVENGYDCSHMIDYAEEIVRDGRTLVSNSLTYGQPRWSRTYVTKFLADNDVDGQAYYDCLGILRAIRRGSVETLSTTEVTEDMLQ
jgi:hypothetical protein